MDPARRTPAEDAIAVSRRGGFVEMLEAVEGDVGGLFVMEPSAGFVPPPSPAASLCTTPYGTMLCFGGAGDKKAVGDEKTPTTTTSSTSSSSSNSGLSKHKSKEGSAGNAPKKQRKGEKQSTGGSNGGGTGKVRKERIGDRIVALQQLVSPFGKSDTASVLHEALGYIKFLHDQVQVLSTPYLQQLPPSARFHGTRSDLRSRGLCLMPLSCTAQLAGSNGADLWSAVTKH